MGKESVYTIKINAELKDLTGKISTAKNALDGLLKSGNAPKGLVSAFERVETLLGRIHDQTKMAPSKQLFASLEKDLNKTGLAFGDLMRNISALGEMGEKIKIELFPPGEQNKINAIVAGLQNYQKALTEIEAKEKAVEKARKASELAKNAASKAKSNKGDAKVALEKKQAKRSGIQAQIDTLDPEKNATQIAKLKTVIAELDIEIKDLNRDYNAASAALTEANKTAKAAAENYSELSTELSNIKTEKLKDMQAAAQKAGVSIKAIDGEEASATMERLSDAMTEFKNNAMLGIEDRLNGIRDGLATTTNTINDATDAVKDGAQAWSEYNDQQNKIQDVQKRIKDFLGYAGAAKVLSSALRQAFQATKELDEAMTEIAVVTDFNIADMWDQLPEYTKRANELGVSITQAYRASALFYQQGLDTNEVIELSNESLKLAKIAGLEASEATDRMTAALRGFNMELNQAGAQKISDVYSELAAITAADVDQISVAMTKTASIASSAGMEFETTAAFLSQIIETTQESAETAGTAMKTVIARFQELKKAPDEIGQIDGEIVDANQIEKALRSVGVQLRDSSGQFRELDDVFLDLSSKWNDLDKNTQRYIATVAAGSRQQSRFIAMMSDYERTQELVGAANDSAGASSRQYEKTLDSLETKLTQLENAWTEFSTSMMNSDFIKGGVDLLTAFVTALNKATSIFDGWLGSVSKIGMIISLFRVAKVMFKKFGDKVIALFTPVGDKIADSIIKGLEGRKDDVVEAAEKVAKEAANGAQTAAEGSGETGAEDQETKKPGLFKRARNAASTFVNNAAMGKSLGKAKVAGDFASNAEEQLQSSASTFSDASVGTGLAEMEGLSQDMNALALPLDSIGKQFEEKLTAIGADTEEVRQKWEELYNTISGGDVSAEQAVSMIDKSLAASGAGKLQVSSDMQAEAANTVTDNAEFGQTKANLAGQVALSSTSAVGGDMANTLAFNDMAQNMQALALPLQEIETQFKEKMASMGASTDSVDKEWSELYTTITSGNSTATEALEAINAKLGETAAQAEKAGKAVDGNQTRIKNTGATAGAAGKAKQNTRAKANKQNQAASKLNKQKEKAQQKEKENNKQAEQDQKKMIDGYKKLTNTIANTGAALSMAGAGFTALGAKFEESGMDGAAKVFNGLGEALGTVGSVMSVVSSIMGFLTPIMSLLTTTTTAQTVASTGQTVANGGQAASWWGVMAAEIGAQTAAWPLLLIMLAIMAVVLVLVLIIWALSAAFEAAAAASPEGQLKAAEESAEKAAETADRAAEAYDNLVSSLEELDGKYEALEDLTRGTKEWNQAVQDINSSVMDLISQYPELAALVENKDGVLTIDMESKGVQDVINDAYAAKVGAANISQLANLRVAEKSAAVQYDNLSNKSRVGNRMTDPSTGMAIASGAAAVLIPGALAPALIGAGVGAGIGELVEANNKKVQTNTDEMAKLMSSGKVYNEDTMLTELEKMGYVGDAAQKMAEELLNNSQALKDYGDSLNALEAQQKAAYDAMAASAVGMLDTAGMLENEVSMMHNLADGEAYKEAFDEMKGKLADEDLIDDSGYQADLSEVTGMTEAQISEAYAQAGYKNATLNDDGTLTYTGEDGKRTTTEEALTETELEDILSSYYASTVVKERAENAQYFVEELTKNLQDNKGMKASDAQVDAVLRALEDGEGSAMTEADLEAWGSMSQADLEAAFNDLPANLKKIYGDAETMAQKITKSQELAQARFDKANDKLAELGVVTRDETGKVVSDALKGISAEAKEGLAEKLEEVSTKAGGTENAQQVSSLIGNIFADVDDATKEEIAARVNATDWSSIEDLTSLQYDLQYSYGVSAEKAKALTDGIASVNGAVSAFVLEIDKFGKMYQAQQALAKSTEELTKLQWEYNQAMRAGGANLSEIMDQTMQKNTKTLDAYKAQFDESQNNIIKKYAQGVGAEGIEKFGIDLSTVTKLNSDGTVSYDSDEITKLIQSGDLKEEEWDTWLSEMEEQREIAEESEQGIRDTIDSIQELEDGLKESYDTLREQAVEAYSNKLQEQIDIQQEQLDATNAASDRMVSKIQESIDDQRQAREQEKMEKAMADNQSKLAYLSMDTSGATALQQQEVQKQLEEQQQEYEDSLIDQAIQNLQDQNAEASEQRERQITLAQQQLDAFLESSMFQQQIDALMSESLASNDFMNSQLGLLLSETAQKGMSSEQLASWQQQTVADAAAAKEWREGAESRKDTVAYANSLLTNIDSTLANDNKEEDAITKSLDTTTSTLETYGFNSEVVGSLTSSAASSDKDVAASANAALSNAKSMIESDNKASDSIKSSQNQLSQLTKDGFLAEGSYYTSAKDYYASLTEEQLKDKNTDSYEEYLAGEVNKNKTTAWEAYGGMAVPGSWAYIDPWEWGEDGDVTVDGTEDEDIDIGQQASETVAKRLDYINNNTGQTGIVLLDSQYTDAPKAGEPILYLKQGTKKWWPVKDEDKSWNKIVGGESDYLPSGLTKAAKDYIDTNDSKEYFKHKFKTGGLADFTGPAWLDGTPDKPEYVLNAAQTEKFFSLIDVLESFNTNKNAKSDSGNHYFDIDINVDQISDDYDVDKLAERIRNIIYEDATYRNVNAINHIR